MKIPIRIQSLLLELPSVQLLTGVKDPNILRIETTTQQQNGESIDLYLTSAGDKFRLSDGGDASAYLANLGLDLACGEIAMEMPENMLESGIARIVKAVQAMTTF